MKYWRGYIFAALFAALTGALMAFAKAHRSLIDMVYPYMTRLIQTSLSSWSMGVDFCLWQLIVIFLGVLVLATIVLMIVFRWNFVQWLGWVLACASLLFCMHTGIYGLNSYSGPLAEDVHLKTTSFTVTELAEATAYFRDIANKLSVQVPRDGEGKPDYPEFEQIAQQAAEGFENLVYERHMSVFAGTTIPVKKLGWADMYTSMGITGVFMPLTGEAAVNAQIPAVGLPFTMCHEMCHRVCIALERDANLGAFLACDANPDPAFRYSGYFMAFRYCYNALRGVGTTTASAAAKEIAAGMTEQLKSDLNDYNKFFQTKQNKKATTVANKVNDAYIQSSGDPSGIRSYGEVTDLLVSWYIQEIYLPAHQDEEQVFDPLDKNQVDLSQGTPEETEGQ